VIVISVSILLYLSVVHTLYVCLFLVLGDLKIGQLGVFIVGHHLEWCC